MGRRLKNPGSAVVTASGADHWLAGCAGALVCRNVLRCVAVKSPEELSLLSNPKASPYLIRLGLSKSLTAIAFLAGPLSGLLVQPLIGEFDPLYVNN